MNKKMIIDAWARIRTIDQTIPDDVLDFMKDAALEKLERDTNEAKKLDIIKNSELLSKYIIVNNLSFTDFMKDENGNIKIYNNIEDVCTDCGMYEFEDALVLKVVYNHVEDGTSAIDDSNMELLNKLENLIFDCIKQAKHFRKNDMETAALSSEAMKTAYTIIKNEILNN